MAKNQSPEKKDYGSTSIKKQSFNVEGYESIF